MLYFVKKGNKFKLVDKPSGKVSRDLPTIHLTDFSLADQKILKTIVSPEQLLKDLKKRKPLQSKKIKIKIKNPKAAKTVVKAEFKAEPKAKAEPKVFPKPNLQRSSSKAPSVYGSPRSLPDNSVYNKVEAEEAEAKRMEEYAKKYGIEQAEKHYGTAKFRGLHENDTPEVAAKKQAQNRKEMEKVEEVPDKIAISYSRYKPTAPNFKILLSDARNGKAVSAAFEEPSGQTRVREPDFLLDGDTLVVPLYSRLVREKIISEGDHEFNSAIQNPKFQRWLGTAKRMFYVAENGFTPSQIKELHQFKFEIDEEDARVSRRIFIKKHTPDSSREGSRVSSPEHQPIYEDSPVNNVLEAIERLERESSSSKDSPPSTPKKRPSKIDKLSEEEKKERQRLINEKSAKTRAENKAKKLTPTKEEDSPDKETIIQKRIREASEKRKLQEAEDKEKAKLQLFEEQQQYERQLQAQKDFEEREKTKHKPISPKEKPKSPKEESPVETRIRLDKEERAKKEAKQEKQFQEMMVNTKKSYDEYQFEKAMEEADASRKAKAEAEEAEAAKPKPKPKVLIPKHLLKPPAPAPKSILKPTPAPAPAPAPAPLSYIQELEQGITRNKAQIFKQKEIIENDIKKNGKTTTEAHIKLKGYNARLKDKEDKLNAELSKAKPSEAEAKQSSKAKQSGETAPAAKPAGSGLGGKLSSQEVKDFIGASYSKKKNANNVGDYILDRELSTKNNKVYYNPKTKKAVIANAGTSSMGDWWNNKNILFGNYETTNRYKEVEDVQKRAITKYGLPNLSNVSHSQSGESARIMAKKGLTNESISLNPAIIGKSHEGVQVIRSGNDLVSAFTPMGENDVTIKADTINPLTEHSNNVLDRVDQDFGKGLKNNIHHIYMTTRGRMSGRGKRRPHPALQSAASVLNPGAFNNLGLGLRGGDIQASYRNDFTNEEQGGNLADWAKKTWNKIPSKYQEPIKNIGLAAKSDLGFGIGGEVGDGLRGGKFADWARKVWHKIPEHYHKPIESIARSGAHDLGFGLKLMDEQTGGSFGDWVRKTWGKIPTKYQEPIKDIGLAAKKDLGFGLRGGKFADWARKIWHKIPEHYHKPIESIARSGAHDLGFGLKLMDHETGGSFGDWVRKTWGKIPQKYQEPIKNIGLAAKSDLGFGLRAGSGLRGGKLVKGSPEAKAYMASIRKRKGSGLRACGLRGGELPPRSRNPVTDPEFL